METKRDPEQSPAESTETKPAAGLDEYSEKARAELLQIIETLDHRDLHLLTSAARAIRDGDDGGALRPAERFIRDIAESYGTAVGLTPDGATEAAKDFCDDFERMRCASADFQKKYGL